LFGNKLELFFPFLDSTNVYDNESHDQFDDHYMFDAEIFVGDWGDEHFVFDQIVCRLLCEGLQKAGSARGDREKSVVIYLKAVNKS
jgi:hypothetical protein